MRRSRLPILGHGPIFRDLNFEFDRDAAIAVLSAGLPITLIPYDAARNMQWTHADIERMQQRSEILGMVCALRNVMDRIEPGNTRRNASNGAGYLLSANR